MPPKRKNRNPKARLHELAADPSKLALPERNFIVAFCAFDSHLQVYRALFSDLKAFSPAMEYIDEIEEGLEEGILWTLAYVNGEMEYGELESNLRVDTAETLQNKLDLGPRSFNEISRGKSKAFENVIDDVEALSDRLCEQLRDKGYELYHVLIGAA